jgi:hypothetical protein
VTLSLPCPQLVLTRRPASLRPWYRCHLSFFTDLFSFLSHLPLSPTSFLIFFFLNSFSSVSCISIFRPPFPSTDYTSRASRVCSLRMERVPSTSSVLPTKLLALLSKVQQQRCLFKNCVPQKYTDLTFFLLSSLIFLLVYLLSLSVMDKATALIEKKGYIFTPTHTHIQTNNTHKTILYNHHCHD